MRLIRVKGYRLKDGKLVPSVKHLDVSARIRQRTSKRVRVVTRAYAEQGEAEVKPAYRCPDTPDMFACRPASRTST